MASATSPRSRRTWRTDPPREQLSHFPREQTVLIAPAELSELGSGSSQLIAAADCVAQPGTAEARRDLDLGPELDEQRVPRWQRLQYA